jgi:von Willebrand factor type A domain
MNLTQTKTAITGSILDMATKNGVSIAETFMSVDAVILVDVSGSMSDCDTASGDSRYDVALKELEVLQADLPGKLAVCEFSDKAKFAVGGIPVNRGGMTDMVKALEFVKKVDGCGIKIILISDGEPDDERATLKIAETFETKIDTVFIGQENSPGRKFLQELSKRTGGISVCQKTAKLHFLGTNLKLLLGA